MTHQKIAISVSEFCALAGIGRTKAYAEISAGRLKILKCGRRTLIPVTELKGWLTRLPSSSEAA